MHAQIATPTEEYLYVIPSAGLFSARPVVIFPRREGVEAKEKRSKLPLVRAHQSEEVPCDRQSATQLQNCRSGPMNQDSNLLFNFRLVSKASRRRDAKRKTRPTRCARFEMLESRSLLSGANTPSFSLFQNNQLDAIPNLASAHNAVPAIGAAQAGGTISFSAVPR